MSASGLASLPKVIRVIRVIRVTRERWALVEGKRVTQGMRDRKDHQD
jgi:hypothetical protein